jgi:hypothetical protein
MHHQPQNQERALNLSILLVSGQKSPTVTPVSFRSPGLATRTRFGFQALIVAARFLVGSARTSSVRDAHRFPRVATARRYPGSSQDRLTPISGGSAFPVPAGVAPSASRSDRLPPP